MNDITVIKLDFQGNESWRYQGRLLDRQSNAMVIEAFFDRDDTPVGELVFRNGDRFVEYYYDDRWFNIYQVFDRETNRLKGWYCNLSLPAQFTDHAIVFHDLALDLVVFPDGSQVILDQEEFDALPIAEEMRIKALEGLDELKSIFVQGANEEAQLLRLNSPRTERRKKD